MSKNQSGNGTPHTEMSDDDFEALMEQAYQGHTQAVLAAVDQDGRLATRADNYRSTLLHVAWEGGGHVELARGLLARGASVGTGDSHGRDATWWASQVGNVALVTLMLDHGGNPARDTTMSGPPL
jgi:ankyrin repeat protein